MRSLLHVFPPQTLQSISWSIGVAASLQVSFGNSQKGLSIFPVPRVRQDLSNPCTVTLCENSGWRTKWVQAPLLSGSVLFRTCKGLPVLFSGLMENGAPRRFLTRALGTRIARTTYSWILPADYRKPSRPYHCRGGEPCTPHSNEVWKPLNTHVPSAAFPHQKDTRLPRSIQVVYRSLGGSMVQFYPSASERQPCQYSPSPSMPWSIPCRTTTDHLEVKGTVAPATLSTLGAYWEPSVDSLPSLTHMFGTFPTASRLPS